MALRTITYTVAWSVLTFVLAMYIPGPIESQQRLPQPKPHKTQLNSNQNLSKILRQITPTGWEIYDRAKLFNSETLYLHIDGRAELYVSYDMNNMTFASYMNTSNNEQFIDLSVYDMGNPTNAFGVYSSERSPGNPSLNLGRSGYRSDASYFIWHGRYYIRIIASETTNELQQTSMDLAKSVVQSLDDSNEPVWGLTVLPETDLVADSVQYFRVNAMGLDFMKNTYTAQYRKKDALVTVFLSHQDDIEAAKNTTARYIAFAKEFGEGAKRLGIDERVFYLCAMGDGYDTVFQNGRVIGGVSSIEDRDIAIHSTNDLWRQIFKE